MGSGCYYTQWTMKRTIGNITEEMKQPSKPYENLSQHAVRHTEVNALKAMVPKLDPTTKDPHGSEEVGDGYTLLHARDENKKQIDSPAGAVIRAYMQCETGLALGNWVPQVHQWAQLHLPTLQIARSAWKEKLKPLNKVWMSWNVKVC